MKENKIIRYTTRFTKNEAEIIIKMCKSLNITIAQFIRYCTLNKL